jgi:hypothetical protein
MILRWRNPEFRHARMRTGVESANWKGGRRISKHGYVMICIGGGAYRFEHCLVAERALGRSLRPDEVVHHIDGDKQNNAPSNLIIMSKAYHHWLHHRIDPEFKAKFMRALVRGNQAWWAALSPAARSATVKQRWAQMSPASRAAHRVNVWVGRRARQRQEVM